MGKREVTPDAEGEGGSGSGGSQGPSPNTQQQARTTRASRRSVGGQNANTNNHNGSVANSGDADAAAAAVPSTPAPSAAVAETPKEKDIKKGAGDEGEGGDESEGEPFVWNMATRPKRQRGEEAAKTPGSTQQPGATGSSTTPGARPHAVIVPVAPSPPSFVKNRYGARAWSIPLVLVRAERAVAPARLWIPAYQHIMQHT